MKTIAKSLLASLFISLFLISPALSLLYPVASTPWYIIMAVSTALVGASLERMHRQGDLQTEPR